MSKPAVVAKDGAYQRLSNERLLKIETLQNKLQCYSLGLHEAPSGQDMHDMVLKVLEEKLSTVGLQRPHAKERKHRKRRHSKSRKRSPSRKASARASRKSESSAVPMVRSSSEEAPSRGHSKSHGPWSMYLNRHAIQVLPAVH